MDGETVLRCADLDAALRLFTGRLGFRLDGIAPADDPAAATLSGHGEHVVLLRDTHEDEPLALRLLRDADVPVPALEPSFVVSRMSEDAPWKTGRAGMLYRDLIPGRQGGYVAASHIRIPAGGPVPDHVHFHDVRFQLIYGVKGWVRLVYEDQGPPFVLEAGDCVLQPPQIRHRVLEASPGLEVIEVACPAIHATFIDHEMTLPTPDLFPDRLFGGQHYQRYEAGSAPENVIELGAGFADQHMVGAGPASAFVRRRSQGPVSEESWSAHRFAFVLAGTARLRAENGEAYPLAHGDAFVLPAGLRHTLDEASEDLRLLVVSVSEGF